MLNQIKLIVMTETGIHRGYFHITFASETELRSELERMLVSAAAQGLVRCHQCEFDFALAGNSKFERSDKHLFENAG